MRICVLSEPLASSASPLAEHDLPCDPAPYLDGHTCTPVGLTKPTAVRQLAGLVHEGGYDLFFNLCDGAWDDPSPGIEVVQALEKLGVPFTGATSAFYEPSREAMKRVCRAWGVAAPAHVMIEADADVERALDTLAFPLIVKHPSSYSSIGLTRASRVETAAALREQVARMTGLFGHAMVEEFVEGREFTVLVAEHPDDPRAPTAYVPIEYRFPEGETFKHYDLKWVDYARMAAFPCADPALDAALREAARRVFVGLNGAGYGRLDVRVDAAGTPHVLEINPNCGVFYPETDPGSADLILLNDPAGHRGFARQVVEAALARHQRGRPRWAVRPVRGNGHGLVATAPIAEGETVLAFEECPHVLVTRAHVERTWDERRKGWFATYAWPLTDEVWVTWAEDPEAWRPINHACDPSAWLDGLDVVARRPLAPGDEITLDYATFCHETMPAFVCRCGAAVCRGVVAGADVLAPFVDRYGPHVSDYVRARRAAERVAAVLP